MNKMNIAAKNLMQNTRGATVVEYIIVLGAVAVICVAIFKGFGTRVSSALGSQSKAFGDNVVESAGK